jgi:excisionase family DNA binding protein
MSARRQCSTPEHVASSAWKAPGEASYFEPNAPEPRMLGEVKKLLQAYTVEQVADMLHVGRDKVYYLLGTGQLRSIKIGKLRCITEQHLAAFIASREDLADAS